jgi:4-hydroxysphinganine ceramide fatty acyl 2-hydroxylase
MLHRYLGHVHKGKNFFKKEHLQHHSELDYFAPVWKKVIAASIVCCFLLFAISYLLTFEIAIGFTAGFAFMYGVYELTHFRYHMHKPIPFFITMRKHHFYHHFQQPNTNFGVTTRFWDRVFGTYVAVKEEVKVPQSMVPNWLLDKKSEQLKSKYQGHFKVVGKRRDIIQ